MTNSTTHAQIVGQISGQEIAIHQAESYIHIQTSFQKHLSIFMRNVSTKQLYQTQKSDK